MKEYSEMQEGNNKEANDWKNKTKGRDGKKNNERNQLKDGTLKCRKEKKKKNY